jgi:hypothetical protein
MLSRKTVAGVVDHYRALENNVGVRGWSGPLPSPRKLVPFAGVHPGLGRRRQRVPARAGTASSVVRPLGAEEGHPMDGWRAQVISRIGSESIIFMLLQLLAKFDRVIIDHAYAGGS